MNRDILKNPTWSGTTNSNISSCRLRSDAIGRLHREKKNKMGVQQTYFLVKNKQYLCCQHFYQAEGIVPVYLLCYR